MLNINFTQDSETINPIHLMSTNGNFVPTASISLSISRTQSIIEKINKYMKTEEEINEMIRIFALANLIEEGIKKVEEKYMFNDDGTITEREKKPKNL